MLRIGLLMALAICGFPALAHACGGVFCDATTLDPIEQRRERILFEVEDEGMITATVEIGYSGDPDVFSWVIPVPGEVEVSFAPPSYLLALDNLTAPMLTGPQVFSAAPDDDDAADDDDDVAPRPVEARRLAEPISSTLLELSPADTAQWLRQRGYAITQAMADQLQHYGGPEDEERDEGEPVQFLVLEFEPGPDTAAIAPIRLRYRADVPRIPLVLTSVASEPELDLVVFIAADVPFVPLNQPDVTDAHRARVRRDPRTGANNWYQALSGSIAEAGGEGWSVELAAPRASLEGQLTGLVIQTDDGDDTLGALRDLAAQPGYLTRLSSRISPQHITGDPAFGPGGADRDATVDLDGAVCASVTRSPPAPCDETACGLGGACAEAGALDGLGRRTQGCVCGPGFALRRVEVPGIRGLAPRPAVTCQDRSWEPSEGLTDGDGPDPCQASDCESGVCVALGGFPVCLCDELAMGTVTSAGLRCESFDTLYPPEQSLWPDWPPPLDVECVDEDEPWWDDDDTNNDDDDDDSVEGDGEGGRLFSCSSAERPASEPAPSASPARAGCGCGRCSQGASDGAPLLLLLGGLATRRRRAV